MKSSELYHSKQKWRLSTMVESTKNTLPETNIFEPKHGGFQYESPFPKIYFQGLC